MAACMAPTHTCARHAALSSRPTAGRCLAGSRGAGRTSAGRSPQPSAPETTEIAKRRSKDDEIVAMDNWLVPATDEARAPGASSGRNQCRASSTKDAAMTERFMALKDSELTEGWGFP